MQQRRWLSATCNQPQTIRTKVNCTKFVQIEASRNDRCKVDASCPTKTKTNSSYQDQGYVYYVIVCLPNVTELELVKLSTTVKYIVVIDVVVKTFVKHLIFSNVCRCECK